ncbi:hypothetical protein GOP47_0009798 [Adiantum capillus-veneris]|uniref:Molybdenum cofactor sulfurase n=1 Tax=Adiantum capillus-veneris TaxID=13818 RepID=A0A9D4UXS6_ADICA|nr:hypothetical protein GOP47_0009798 [Adiantum capillus-veneris]
MPCKPVTLCSSLLSSQKKKQREAAIADVVEPVKRGKENGIVLGKGVSLKRAPSSTSSSTAATVAAEKGKPFRRSSSQVHREFLRATAGVSDGKLISFFDTLPSCEEAYSHFIQSYPRFAETRALDHLRLQEYTHLEEEELACLDYCGFGLFSQAQQDDIAAEEEGFSSTFVLSEISANLWSHALFGSAPEGTMECAIRARIMEFLNVPSSEYSMVFTASRGATFKLLADAYPWSTNSRLVTMYDYESESVGWMEQRAADSEARVYRARFRWPSLRVCSTELKKELMAGSSKKMKAKSKKKQGVDGYQISSSSSRLTVASWLDRVSLQQQHPMKEKKKGLFAFPVQSRVSGAKYSYQWMSLAQQNHWHVLLDASALGPKDMDSLGLSLFRPDFITASFYKLFGGDPSGFGCLLIKNSVAQSIQDSSGVPVSGMVRIAPLPSQWTFSSSCTSEDSSERYDEGRMISSFSGPMPAIDEVDIQTPLELEADDNYSSACEDPEFASVGGFSRSPVFSEDGHDDPFSADAGPSPVGTGSCASASEEGFSGPLQEDLSHITIQESHRLPGRRDGFSSKSRIKGLCSGLLHLHSGRVGNSGDSIGEDVSVSRDVEKVKKTTLVKHVAFQSKEVEEQGKPVLNGVILSKVQSNRHDFSESGEHIPERLVLVLKKIREEQLSLGNGELSLGSHVKEHERKILARRANEILQHREEESPLDMVGQGGLETIEEIEMEGECLKSSELSDLGAIRGSPLEASKSIMSMLDTTNQGSAVQKGSAICRETEGGFRLLGCRNADPFSLGRIFNAGPGDDSFASRSIGSGGRDFSSMERSIGSKSDEDQVEGDFVEEPQLLCRSLDHADMMGLNKTSVRLRYLINWLVSSLLSLRHPENDSTLVRIYGPQVRYDRGASIAFNILDSQGKLLQPDLVRMLADQVNVSLGLGYLRNIYCRGNFLEVPRSGSLNVNANGVSSKVATVPSRVEVVTAALGLLSDFRDVYKLWSFVAKFLDPGFVSSEVGSLQPSNSGHRA